MLRRRAAAAFEHIGKAHEIAVDIGMGILDAVANPRLGGEVEHPFRPCLVPDALEPRPVGEIDEGQLETVALVEHPTATLLQSDVVIGRQIVKADHGEAVAQQPLAEVKADEARGTGDDDPGRRGEHRR